MDDNKKKIDAIIGDYKFGFRTENNPVAKTKKGLDESVVRSISDYKSEPDWMREFRLKSYEKFLAMKNPKWGPDLSGIDFDDFTYFIRASDKSE
ncbi:MAG TPA: Fe-S cluster assembly protein SufB, partial [Acholeplasma sp.]|nr:Fe-S cluster assembly protein SufB [Acholeplasma sp.]